MELKEPTGPHIMPLSDITVDGLLYHYLMIRCFLKLIAFVSMLAVVICPSSVAMNKKSPIHLFGNPPFLFLPSEFAL